MENPNTWNDTQKLIHASLCANEPMDMVDVLNTLNTNGMLIPLNAQTITLLAAELQSMLNDYIASDVVGYSYATVIYNRLKEIGAILPTT